MNTPLQPQWEKKSRFLTQLLIWSGALNIGLLCSLIYVVLKDRPETIPFELRPATSSQVLQVTNQEILSMFANLSWGELVAFLNDEELVEEGYKKRDLALATLVAFHGLDIDRALQGTFVQKRKIALKRKEGPEEFNLILYPGLSQEQFSALQRFIQTERFPFTALGLFHELQQRAAPRNPELLQAFYLTPEFNAVSTLCQRTGVHLPKEFIIELIAQGDWSTLHAFTEEQKVALNLSPDRLKNLLLSYIQHRSILAAKILLQWDRDFILKRFEDKDLISFMDLHHDTALLKELMASPRSDLVRKKAAEKLNLPLVADLPAPPPQPPQEIKHTIVHGDNLWKIARKYKVSVESLRKANHLETDKLREGKSLIIPQDRPRQDL